MSNRLNLPPWRDCDKNWEADFNKYLEENKTLAYLILKNAKIYKDATVLTQKNIHGEWENISWEDFGERIVAVAKSLIDMGVQPGDMCSVFSRNCAEWAVSDMGILATRAVSVQSMLQTPERRLNISSIMLRLKCFSPETRAVQ